ncbi:MAG: histidine kinase [Candidatus Limnocylindrales bacterium]
MMLRRRRWLLVVLVVAIIGLVELVSDSLLDPIMPFPWDTVVVVGVVALFGVTGAWFAFRSLDHLTATLHERNVQLEASNQATRALHRVSLALSTLPELQAILQAVVDNARTLLEADVALLVLTRSDGTLRLAAWSGAPDAFAPTGEFEGHDFQRFVRADVTTTHLAAPVRRRGRSIGTLAVGSRAEQAYAVEAVETLASLAGQAAIAIENDRLQSALRDLAIRDERERIAREMHDGLAQVLGYVNTKSQAVEELLAVNRLDAARAQLAELAAAARSVYGDVREAILGLSSPIAPEHGLVGALEAYAQRFSEASKVATVVEADEEALALQLRPMVQAQTFRIVQEALTNVRKHAAAERARIVVERRGDELLVRVEDDGRGLTSGAPDAAGWPSFGLQSMRERAAGLGGRLEIVPGPGTGTCLELHLPLMAALEVA